MICVCMQPSFLPWLGYIDLYAHADVFVVLDDCQFEPRCWQQRNRILGNSELQWLTVPVHRTGLRGQLIREVQLAEDAGKKRDKILKTITQHYSKTRYYDLLMGDLREIFSTWFRPGGKLLDLDLRLFGWMLTKIGLGLVDPAQSATLPTRCVLSSSLKPEGTRSSMLLDICRKVGCDKYLTTVGSCDYLRQDQGTWKGSGVEVLVHNYEHPVYSQGQVFQFIPFASALDLMMRHLEHGAEIIVSGRREAKTLFGEGSR